MHHQLVERDSELAAIDTALASARDGFGAAVLVEGEAGIGKSALLGTAARIAGDGEMTVLRARATPLEEGVAYGVVRQLLLPTLLEADDRERLLSGAAALAEPALLGADAMGPPAPEAAFAARHGLIWLVAALAADGPLALVVDDAHWADGPSLRFLYALSERISELPVALLIGARPPAAWADPALLADLNATSLRVLPSRLTVAGVGESLAGRLGIQPDAAFTTAAHTQTAGTPYLIIALAEALKRAGAQPVGASADAIRALAGAEIGRDVAKRVRALGFDAQAIVRAIAVLGDGRPAAEAERVAGLPGGSAARAAPLLEASGLVRGWPAPGFDHPLVRSAVIDDIPIPQRADLHARAARIAAESGEPERAAAHLAEAPATGDADRVALLLGVGARALRSGAPDVAARHLRRALAEPPPEALRGGVLLELGLTELDLGEPTAPDRLLAAAAATSDPELALHARMGAGYGLAFTGRWEEAVAAMAYAVEAGAGAQPTTLALARIGQAGTMLTNISTGRAARAMLAALDAEIPLDAPARTSLDGVLAVAEASGGAPRTAVLDRVARVHSAPLPTGLDVPMRAMPLIALVLVDAFAEADAALGEIVVAARASGDLTSVRILSAWQAVSRVRQGRLIQAEEAALSTDEGEGAAPALAQVLATGARAEAALERGDLDAAAHYASYPLDQDTRVHDTNFVDAHLVTRGRVLLARGEVEEAESLFAAAGARQVKWGGVSPNLSQWRIGAAHAARALGKHARADELIEEEIAAAQQCGVARTIGMALRARAALAPRPLDGERDLRDAIDVLDTTTVDLQRALARADLGELLLADGRGDEGRDVLRQALDMAWACGADPLAERARGALVQAGARPRRAELTGVRALTPAEARTARMAVAATNREIAESLFITEKTVETHLTSTYRKLGIAGRPQLAAALGSH